MNDKLFTKPKDRPRMRSAYWSYRPFRHRGKTEAPRTSPQTGRDHPNVWSGRALQEVFVDLADVRSCINVSGLCLERECSGPSWISARVRSHYRTGLDWAIWVTSVRTRREDRSSISSHPLADLGG